MAHQRCFGQRGCQRIRLLCYRLEDRAARARIRSRRAATGVIGTVLWRTDRNWEEIMDIRSLHELRGSVAVVTGAGGGIGAATALALAQWGATVVATDKAAQTPQRSAEAVTAEGGAASH